MDMSYSKNPNLPKVRAEAVKMVRSGKSVREVARHYGYSHSAVVKWCQKVPNDVHQYRVITTESSRPHHHPSELSDEVVRQILEYRHTTKRGAEFIHVLLQKKGVTVSLSSVKRTLSRHGLTRYSKWKKWHQGTPRPLPEAPGILVEADTIHVGRKDGSELYVYTLIDLHSRWVYATAAQRISAAGGASFALTANKTAPFRFQTVQTDHGPEFSTWFTKKLLEQQITHRHTRVRKPNDNAHIERFNRTIQEECLGSRLSSSIKTVTVQEKINEYLKHYNTKRVHLSLQYRKPIEMLQSS